MRRAKGRPPPAAAPKGCLPAEPARTPVAHRAATFSGGEQQRVNIARGFIRPSPILLLDEPTASLDGANRQVVIDLIREARGNGAAIVGIFHDDVAREAVADRTIPVRRP